MPALLVRMHRLGDRGLRLEVAKDTEAHLACRHASVSSKVRADAQTARSNAEGSLGKRRTRRARCATSGRATAPGADCRPCRRPSSRTARPHIGVRRLRTRTPSASTTSCGAVRVARSATRSLTRITTVPGSERSATALARRQGSPRCAARPPSGAPTGCAPPAADPTLDDHSRRQARDPADAHLVDPQQVDGGGEAATSEQREEQPDPASRRALNRRPRKPQPDLEPQLEPTSGRREVPRNRTSGSSTTPESLSDRELAHPADQRPDVARLVAPGSRR